MESKQRQHIATAIRSARLRHGWGVGEAAERIGVSGPAWSRWESASTAPKPATLVELGHLLGLDDGWWELSETLSHPVTMLTEDELLARIRAELEEHERRIEAMLERLTGVGHNDRGQRPATGPVGSELHESRDDQGARRPPAP